MFNERPTREDLSTVITTAEEKAALATMCMIHTSMGDIVSPSPSYPSQDTSGLTSAASQAVP